MKTLNNKKAQLTMFIILGIVIIVIFGFVFFATGEVTKQRSERQAEKIYEEILDTTSLKFYVTQCTERALKNGIDLLSKQGGKLTPTQLGSLTEQNEKIYMYEDKATGRTYYVNYGILREDTPLPQYPCKIGFKNYYIEPDFCNYRQSSLFNNMDFGIVNLPHLCRDRYGGCTIKEGWNPRFSLQLQLESYVSEYVKDCVDFESITGIAETYDIEEGDTTTAITFSDRDITAHVSFPLVISVPGEQPVVRLADFQTTYPTRFKLLYGLAREVVVKDVSSPTAPDFNLTVEFKKLVENKFGDDGGFLIIRRENVLFNDDFIRILDKRAAEGTQLLVQFLIENRQPVLEYINKFGPVGADPPDGCGEYDIVQMQDTELSLNRLPLELSFFDTDEDELTVIYSGWLAEWNETNTAIKGDPCPSVTTNPEYFDNPLQQNRWNIDSNGVGSVMLTKRDIGPHVFNISVCDANGECDYQNIRILVDDFVSITIEPKNIFGGDYLSLEDPFTFTAALDEYYDVDPDQYSFNWIISQAGTPLKTYSEQELDFPQLDYDIFNIHKKYTPFELGKSYTVTAQVIQAGTYQVVAKTSITPVACIPYNPTDIPFPYKIVDNSKFLAGHTCCTASFTPKSSSETCYTADTYGSYLSFDSERYKREEYDQQIKDEIGIYDEPPAEGAALIASPSNDIFKRHFVRKCDGTRGNICAGDIKEKYTFYKDCLPDKGSNLAACSGPDIINSEERFPNDIDCELYDRTTFEFEAGLRNDIKCSTSPRCVADITTADGSGSGEAHYFCTASTCGYGQCTRPIPGFCTDCYAGQTCSGPTTSTRGEKKTLVVKEFNGCPSTACTFIDPSYKTDVCNGDILTDYYCNTQVSADGKIYDITTFDCKDYPEDGATDSDYDEAADSYNNPYVAGACTPYEEGTCSYGECHQGAALTPIQDGKVGDGATGYSYKEYYPLGITCAEELYDYDDLTENMCKSDQYGNPAWKWDNNAPVGSKRRCCGDDVGEYWDASTSQCKI